MMTSFFLWTTQYVDRSQAVRREVLDDLSEIFGN